MNKFSYLAYTDVSIPIAYFRVYTLTYSHIWATPTQIKPQSEFPIGIQFWDLPIRLPGVKIVVVFCPDFGIQKLHVWV